MYNIKSSLPNVHRYGRISALNGYQVSRSLPIIWVFLLLNSAIMAVNLA